MKYGIIFDDGYGFNICIERCVVCNRNEGKSEVCKRNTYVCNSCYVKC